MTFGLRKFGEADMVDTMAGILLVLAVGMCVVAFPFVLWMEARKRELAADLKVQQGDMEIAIHPNLPELYRRKVAKLQRVLHDEAIRPQAVEIIRSLIDRIEVHPGPDRGHCEVIIVGALAQILAFARQKTTAASAGDGCS